MKQLRLLCALCALLLITMLIVPTTFLTAEDVEGRTGLFGSHTVSSNTDIKITGATGGSPVGDELGLAFATGDIDDDGMDDLFVSAQYAAGNETGYPGAGEVYCFYGQDRSSWTADIDLSTLTPDIVIKGNMSEDMFGTQIELGDVNDDNIDDLLISAPGFGLPAPTPTIYRENIGAVYVIYGGSRASLGSSINADTECDVRMYGKIDTEEMGQGLAVADIDNDGIDDIIMGSPICSKTGYSTVGAVFIIYGSASLADIYIFNTTGWGTVFPDHYDCVLWGWEQGSKMGWRLDADDINADGYADIIVGAPQTDGFDGSIENAGSYLVVLGNERATLTGEMWMADRVNLTVHGDGLLNQLGKEVELGDVDQDGFLDMLATAPYGDGPGDARNEGGEAFLTWGSNSSFMGLGPKDGNSTRKELNITQLNGIALYGGDAGDHMGSKCAMGDVNGDMYVDILLSAPDGENMDDSGTKYGEVAMVYGSSRGAMASTYDLDTDADLMLYGDGAYDSLGSALHVGDIDGDGLGEVMVSAMSADGPGNGRADCGEAYIIYGNRLSISTIELLDGYDIGMQTHTGGTTCFAGTGPNHIQINVTDTLGGADIASVDLHLDAAGNDITLRLDGGGFSVVDGAGFVSLQTGACVRDDHGFGSNITFAFTFDWNFPTENLLDLDVTIFNSTGSNITAMYPGFLKVENDLDIYGSPVIHSAAMGNVSVNGSWIPGGDSLNIFGMRAVYEGTMDVYPPVDEYDIEVRNGSGSSIHPSQAMGNIDVTVPGPTAQDEAIGVMYSVALTNIGKPGLQPLDVVDRSDVSTYLRVDDKAPEDITNITIHPDAFDDEEFNGDNDDEMFLKWIGGEDMATYNGTLEQMSYNYTEYFLGLTDNSGTTNGTMALESGGLMGHYYNTDNFEELALARLDETLHFDTTDWGPWSPAYEVNVDHFSARWLGYLYCNYTSLYTFYVDADEGVLIYIDDVLYYDHMGTASSSQFIVNLDEGYHSFRVEYMERTGDAHLEIEWETSLITKGPISPLNLFHPVQRSTIDGLVSGYNTVYIWSMDAFGNFGDVSTVEALVDLDGLDIINLGPSSTGWFDNRSQTLACRVVDDGGSGVDIGSIQYALAQGSTAMWGSWNDLQAGEFEVDTSVSNGMAINVSVQHEFAVDGSHFIKWRASDKAENGPFESPVYEVKVDTTLPLLKIDKPESSIIYATSNVPFDIWLWDSASGIDTSKVEYRVKGPADATFGNWTAVDTLTMNIENNGKLVKANLTMPLNEGTSTIELRVTDVAGNGPNSTQVTVVVDLPEVFLPPVPFIMSPSDGANFTSPTVQLSANGTTDPDTAISELEFHWFVDFDTYLGSGMDIEAYIESGTHQITLYVYDGVNNASTSVSITIDSGTTDGTQPDGNATDGDGGGGGMNTFLIVLVAILVVFLLIAVVIVALYFMRKKPTEEVRMEMTERTEDDDEYDERTEEDRKRVSSEDDIVEKSDKEIQKEAAGLYGDEASKPKKGKKGKRKQEEDIDFSDYLDEDMGEEYKEEVRGSCEIEGDEDVHLEHEDEPPEDSWEDEDDPFGDLDDEDPYEDLEVSDVELESEDEELC